MVGVAAPDDRTAPPGGIHASIGIASADDMTSPSLVSVPSEVAVGSSGFSSLTPIDPDGLPHGPAAGWAEAAVDYSGAEDRTNPTTTGDPFGGAPAARLSPGPALPPAPAPPPPGLATAPGPSAQPVGVQAWEAEMRARAIRVPVPELAGFVISRIGTPTAMSRLALRVPIRATDLDTLVPHDFVLDLEMREARGSLRHSARSQSRQPVLSARRVVPASSAPQVPASAKLFFAMVCMLCATMIIMAILYNAP